MAGEYEKHFSTLNYFYPLRHFDYFLKPECSMDSCLSPPQLKLKSKVAREVNNEAKLILKLKISKNREKNTDAIRF